MSSSIVSMVRSGVSGVRDGADAVSHALGDVLDDMKSRVEDLVDVAHPRKVVVRRRRTVGLFVTIVVVAGAVLVRKRMSRISTISGHGSASKDGSAADSRAEMLAA